MHIYTCNIVKFARHPHVQSSCIGISLIFIIFNGKTFEHVPIQLILFPWVVHIAYSTLDLYQQTDNG